MLLIYLSRGVYTLSNFSTSGHTAPLEGLECVHALRAQLLDNQGSFLPDLERDGGTAGGEVYQRHRNLRGSVHQVLAVVIHAESKNRGRVVVSVERAGEVSVGNHAELSDASVDCAAKVEAGDDSVA